MACITCRYSAFFLTSYTFFFMCYRLTPHMISTNSPLSFSSTCLDLGDFSNRYTPVTLNVPLSSPSYASITNVFNRSSKDTVGWEIIYPYFRYHLWVLPLAHEPPFTLSYWFTYIKFHSIYCFLILVQENQFCRHQHRLPWHWPFIYMFTLFDHFRHCNFTKSYDTFFWFYLSKH